MFGAPFNPRDLDLEADSEDLGDAEIEGALHSASPEDVRSHLSSRTCSEDGCGRALHPFSFALRRRTPDLYTRVGLTCTVGHRETLVIRTTWVGT